MFALLVGGGGGVGCCTSVGVVGVRVGVACVCVDICVFGSGVVPVWYRCCIGIEVDFSDVVDDVRGVGGGISAAVATAARAAAFSCPYRTTRAT